MSAIISLAVAAVLVGVDQLLKAVVVANLKPVGTVNCIPGLLDWTYLENRGAAFGVLQDHRWLFIVFSSLLIAACVALLFTRFARSKWAAATLALIIAGGVGNLIDRIANGFVVDYVSLSFFPPVFNFADCCVTVGAVMAAVYFIFIEPRRSARERREETPPAGSAQP